MHQDVYELGSVL